MHRRSQGWTLARDIAISTRVCLHGQSVVERDCGCDQYDTDDEKLAVGQPRGVLLGEALALVAGPEEHSAREDPVARGPHDGARGAKPFRAIGPETHRHLARVPLQ